MPQGKRSIGVVQRHRASADQGRLRTYADDGQKKDRDMNSVWKQTDVGAPKDGTKVLFLARPAVGGFETPEPVVGYWIDNKWRDCPIAGIPGRVEIEIRPSYWTEIPEH
jgi:hypothetical protein